MNKTESYIDLKKYCEITNYQGWDPYDGLNSKLFQATPLKYWPFARLAWIQLFKRNPLNLRKVLMVPKGHNPKAIGLFLTGYCNLHQLAKAGEERFGTSEEIQEKIKYLADLLIDLQAEGYSGACWGYNFDWQNRVFYQPKYTPTVVVTSFCGEALFKAYDITKNKRYLDCALSACNFVTNDLNRSKIKKNEFIFSYSPLDQTKVYNASLLGAKLLAIGYSYSDNQEWLILSVNATTTIVNKQAEDGSWIYGEDKVQGWVDSYHTGFNLECIWKVMHYTREQSFMPSFNKGMNYYLNNFFLEDGRPKYYHDKIYPLDIHSPAQLIATLSSSDNLIAHKELSEKVLNWTIENMQNKNGYFYYQLKKVGSSKIPYMRWAQAWMFYAFSEYFKSLEN